MSDIITAGQIALIYCGAVFGLCVIIETSAAYSSKAIAALLYRPRKERDT